MKRSEAFTSALLDTIEDVTTQLEQCATDIQLSGSIDLSKTMDLSTAEGNNMLHKLSHSKQGKLQQCRQVSLRWQSLLSHLHQSDQVRQLCLELYRESNQLLDEYSLKEQIGDMSKDEATEDVKCATACMAHKLEKLRIQATPNLWQLSMRLIHLVSQCLREEIRELDIPGHTESEGAQRQRLQYLNLARDAVVRLDSSVNGREAPQGKTEHVSIAELPMQDSLEILERCVGQRIWQ